MQATGARHLVLWWPLGELLASKKQPVLNSRPQLGLWHSLSFSDIKGMAGGLLPVRCGGDSPHKKWAPGRRLFQSCTHQHSSVVDSSCS